MKTFAKCFILLMFSLLMGIAYLMVQSSEEALLDDTGHVHKTLSSHSCSLDSRRYVVLGTIRYGGTKHVPASYDG